MQLENQRGSNVAKSVLYYVFNGVDAENESLLIEKAKHYPSTELQGEIMTLAQQLRQEGMQLGIQQGVLQGEITLLIRQLQHRFGKISLAILERIQRADAETLLIWGERVLTAKNITEIFE